MTKEDIVEILQKSLSTELICFLRYRNHYNLAVGINSEPIRTEFLDHSNDEKDHSDWLSQRITELGGKPDYNPKSIVNRSTVDYVEGVNLLQMIKENIAAESIAIETYTHAIQQVGVSDPTTRTLLEKILSKEEEHKNDLDNLV